MTDGEVTRDDHPETFSRVLGEVAGAFDGAGIPYVIIGSVASTYYGRPGPNGDLDLLVQPQDAKRALETLGQSHFETDEFDPAWIFKATKHGILVDVIFRAHGNIYLDDAMLEHAVRTRIAGHLVPLVSPEDASSSRSSAMT
jgi:hypothetical protein